MGCIFGKVHRCHCCQRELQTSDKIAKSFWCCKTYGKCIVCHEVICKSCGLSRSCHECEIRTYVRLGPDMLMAYTEDTLRRYLISLHYSNSDLHTFPKEYLVKQLLQRFQLYTDWNPEPALVQTASDDQVVLRNPENGPRAVIRDTNGDHTSVENKMPERNHSTWADANRQSSLQNTAYIELQDQPSSFQHRTRDHIPVRNADREQTLGAMDMTFGASSKLDNYNHQLVINGNQDRITTFSDRAPTLAEMKTQDEIYRLSRWQMERILQEAGLDPAFFPTEAEMMSQILDQWHRMRETEFSVPENNHISSHSLIRVNSQTQPNDVALSFDTLRSTSTNSLQPHDYRGSMIKELQPPTAIVQNNNDFSTQPSSIQPAVVPPNIPSSHDDWSHEGHSRPQKPKREFKPTRQPPVPPPRSSTTTKSQNSPLPISESTSTKDLTNTLNQFFGQEIEKSSTITYSLFDIESPEDVARMDVQQLLGHLREHGIEATEDTERSILVAQVTSLWTRKEIQAHQRFPSGKRTKIPSLQEITSESQLEDLTVYQLRGILKQHGQQVSHYLEKLDLLHEVKYLWLQVVNKDTTENFLNTSITRNHSQPEGQQRRLDDYYQGRDYNESSNTNGATFISPNHTFSTVDSTVRNSLQNNTNEKTVRDTVLEMGEVSRDSSHPNRESLGQLNTLQEYRYAGSPHLDSPMIRGSLNDYQTNHRTNQHVRHVSGDTSYFYEEPGTSFTNYTIGQTITDYRATTTRQTSHESFAADNVIESQEVGLPVFQEKRKSLADIHKPEEIQNLPIREMESLLAKYEIKTAPGMETGHLVELVTRLWNKRQSQGSVHHPSIADLERHVHQDENNVPSENTIDTTTGQTQRIYLERFYSYPGTTEQSRTEFGVVTPSLQDITCREDVSKLSIRQMIKILTNNAVDTSHCTEKSELESLVLDLWKNVGMQKEGDRPEEPFGGKQKQCIQCKRNDIDCLLLNCAHLILCQDCAYNIQYCPSCGEFVSRIVRVYRS